MKNNKEPAPSSEVAQEDDTNGSREAKDQSVGSDVIELTSVRLHLIVVWKLEVRHGSA